MRVVLGEDLTLLRDGLIRLLTAYDMEVVAAVDNGPDLLRALVTHRPDVAVVDVRLPPGFTDEGLKAAIEARAQVPGLPVLRGDGGPWLPAQGPGLRRAAIHRGRADRGWRRYRHGSRGRGAAPSPARPG